MRLSLSILIMSVATAAAAQTHPCEGDAILRAGPLLKLHWNDAASVLADAPDAPSENGDAQAWSLDTAAAVVAPVRALAGDGSFDVLEVNGYVYRATYRMRFVYAQIPDECVLMGQEILEVADPY